MEATNPVHYEPAPFQQMGDHGEPVEYPAGWYFWDEVWIFQHGPFDTEEKANEACNEYARNL